MIVSFDKMQIRYLKDRAKDLAAEGNENPEYNRALCELIGEVDFREDVPLSERTNEIASELGIQIITDGDEGML